jgi:hypothetical protein
MPEMRAQQIMLYTTCNTADSVFGPHENETFRQGRSDVMIIRRRRSGERKWQREIGKRERAPRTEPPTGYLDSAGMKLSNKGT